MADEAGWRCGDCRHWGTQEEAVDGETFRTCQAVRHSGGEASYPRSAAATMKSQYPDSLAGTMDGSDYWSVLVAREDFGCVLFEPKEQS